MICKSVALIRPPIPKKKNTYYYYILQLSFYKQGSGKLKKKKKMCIIYYLLDQINNTCMTIKLRSGIKDVFYLQMTSRSVYIKRCMCNYFNRLLMLIFLSRSYLMLLYASSTNYNYCRTAS